MALLSCRDNELFLRYFKTNLTRLVRSQRALFEARRSPELPDDFWDDHISATFVETLRYWIDHGMKQTPEQITRYFLLAV